MNVRFYISILLLYFVSVGAVWVTAPKIYYVSEYGSGAKHGLDVNNSCSGLSDPDCTPAPGDVIYLCGEFTSQIRPYPVDGTQRLRITYDWKCPGNPAYLSLNGTQTDGVLVDGRKFLSWNDVRVFGPTNSVGGNGSLFLVIRSENIIVNNPVTYNNTETGITPGATRGHGIFFGGGTRFSVINNAISYGNHGHGIRFQHSLTSHTEHNQVNGCESYNNHRHGVAITGHPSDASRLRYILIDKCITYGNGDGIYSHNASDITVTNSIAHHNSRTISPTIGESYGIASEKTINFTASYNIVYDNDSDGIEVWGDAVIPTTNCKIIGNIVFNHTHFRTLNPENLTGNNGIEQRTGYGAGCAIIGNISYNNTRNYKIANDSTNTSIFASNISMWGEVGLYLDKSNENNNFSASGWTIIGNTFKHESKNWLFTPLMDNNNRFIYNVWYGDGSAVYNNTTYTKENINLLDESMSITEPFVILNKLNN